MNVHWKEWCWGWSFGQSQYFGYLIRRASSLEKTLILGKIEGRRRGGDRAWNSQMTSVYQWTRIWANSARQWRTGKPGILCMVHGVSKEPNTTIEEEQEEIWDIWLLFGYLASETFSCVWYNLYIKGQDPGPLVNWH